MSAALFFLVVLMGNQRETHPVGRPPETRPTEVQSERANIWATTLVDLTGTPPPKPNKETLTRNTSTKDNRAPEVLCAKTVPQLHDKTIHSA